MRPLIIHFFGCTQSFFRWHFRKDVFSFVFDDPVWIKFATLLKNGWKFVLRHSISSRSHFKLCVYAWVFSLFSSSFWVCVCVCSVFSRLFFPHFKFISATFKGHANTTTITMCPHTLQQLDYVWMHSYVLCMNSRPHYINPYSVAAWLTGWLADLEYRPYIVRPCSMFACSYNIQLGSYTMFSVLCSFNVILMRFFWPN